MRTSATCFQDLRGSPLPPRAPVRPSIADTNNRFGPDPLNPTGYTYCCTATTPPSVRRHRASQPRSYERMHADRRAARARRVRLGESLSRHDEWCWKKTWCEPVGGVEVDLFCCGVSAGEDGGLFEGKLGDDGWSLLAVLAVLCLQVWRGGSCFRFVAGGQVEALMVMWAEEEKLVSGS